VIEGFTAIVAEAGPRTAAMWLASSVAFNIVLLALLLYKCVLDITQEQGDEL
jgi:hypothetical protein